MRFLVASSLLVFGLAACGGRSAPAPHDPAPADTTDPVAACHLDGPDATPTTMEQCQCLGHAAVGDIGDGNVACPEGTIEVAKIRFGIEGGVCCTQPVPMPAS